MTKTGLVPVFLSESFIEFWKLSVEPQFIILLSVLGVLSGALYATTKIVSPLCVVPCVLLFLPVFGLEYQGALLPIIATAITAFIPILLVEWVGDMKHQKVDAQVLMSLSPGASMGGVIGAQIVSFMAPVMFKLSLGLVLISLLISSLLAVRQIRITKVNLAISHLNQRFVRTPVGMLVGVISVMAGGSGHSLGKRVLGLYSMDGQRAHSTAIGMALFVSIAAMVGFSFPAVPLAFSYQQGFVGAIQIVACLVLAVSQFGGFWLCRNKGSSLDRKVISISYTVFLVIAGVRVFLLDFS